MLIAYEYFDGQTLTKRKGNNIEIAEPLTGRYTYTCTPSPGSRRADPVVRNHRFLMVYPRTTSGSGTRTPNWRWSGMVTGTESFSMNNLATNTWNQELGYGYTQWGFDKTNVLRVTRPK